MKLRKPEQDRERKVKLWTMKGLDVHGDCNIQNSLACMGNILVTGVILKCHPHLKIILGENVSAVLELEAEREAEPLVMSIKTAMNQSDRAGCTRDHSNTQSVTNWVDK